MGRQMKIRKRNGNSLRPMGDFILHPLIHTSASEDSAQDSGVKLSRLGLNIACQDVNFREIKDKKRGGKWISDFGRALLCVVEKFQKMD